MKAFIMRGPPGSGKTRWVRDNLPGALVFSTDSYFMVGGEYRFDPALLGKHHDRCLVEYARAVLCSATPVVVDNTNTRLFELAPYYRLAEAHGYEVEVVWLQATPETCRARNVHGVPDHVIDSMLISAEPLPPWWSWRVVNGN